MAGLEHFTFTNELRTTLLQSRAKQGGLQVSIKYDPRFDALRIYFLPQMDCIVHYIDDYVGLLYQPETKEIIGMHIEDFVHSFLAQHGTVESAWRLSESDSRNESLAELAVVFERKTSQLTREIVKSTEDLLEKEGLELGDVLA
ncbi:MAG: hypothetical protein K8L97_22335 [Anaerolineae bacterium]|nr:hypothetical protein [Anaerolineae bacterium]